MMLLATPVRGLDSTAGIILAGGLSRRMGGGDKCLRLLGGRPLVSYVIHRLEGQVARLALNANGDPSRFSTFGLPVIPDATADFAGPLAGVLAGLRWAAKATPQARFIATAACDTPFFPVNFVQVLLGSTKGAYPCLALAASAGRVHPVFALWPIALADDLALSLQAGTRKVLGWTERHPHVITEFAFTSFGENVADPFFNANTPEDLAEAERLLAKDKMP